MAVGVRVGDGVCVGAGINFGVSEDNAIGVPLDCAQALIPVHRTRMKMLLMKYLSMKLLFYLIAAQRPALAASERAETRLESQEKLKARKSLKKRAESHLSAAPWHDGERSFSTKEGLVVYTRKMQKGVVFQKMAHFPRFPGEVLRTLCWAVFALYSIL